MSRFTGAYDAAWDATATAVKDAVGWKCVRCKHPHGDRIVSRDEYFGGEGDAKRRLLNPCTPDCSHQKDGKMRVLTVHHLDGHKANDAWWNLLALCQVCHLQVQAKVIPERQFLFQHSAWFVPYVCGFYAHYYGKESITREQADANPHHYLQMGQPWLYEATT